MPKRVAVLLGGMSPERPVSLVSGKACADALRRKGFDVVEIDADRALAAKLVRANPDVVLNALHGEWGEDGRVQGVLDLYGKPYTHSGVLASALAMDKDKTKAVLKLAGLDVPEGLVATREQAAGGHLMDPPYVVKPNGQGSSVGVFIVRQGDNRPPEQLSDPQWDLGDELVVEEFIPGRELTVAVLGDRALAVTEITTNAVFYDYDAKYTAGGSQHACPADIPESLAERCLAEALTAHQVLGCRGLTRTDFRFDPGKDRLAILEVNTQPGMTPTSLAPEQAAHVGIVFDDLVEWMVEDASCPR